MEIFALIVGVIFLEFVVVSFSIEAMNSLENRLTTRKQRKQLNAMANNYTKEDNL